MLQVLDLFSGIGGFSLGLERTGGFRTIGFCEIDAYCRRVLRHHWPDVPIHDDVRRLSGVAGIDVICGGFPCQDISFAGQGAGLSGARSGLWFEYFRIIEESRPQWVIIENVAALRGRGLDVVLGCLASIGYDAEWHCIPAAAVGAPHRRDRVWVVAYPNGQRESQPSGLVGDERRWISNSGALVADADSERRQRAGIIGQRPRLAEPADSSSVRDTYGPRLALGQSVRRDDGAQFTTLVRTDWWLVEPDVGRVAHGIPARVDRLKSLGNSIVPQIAQLIGEAILSAHC